MKKHWGHVVTYVFAKMYRWCPRPDLCSWNRARSSAWPINSRKIRGWWVPRIDFGGDPIQQRNDARIVNRGLPLLSIDIVSNVFNWNKSELNLEINCLRHIVILDDNLPKWTSTFELLSSPTSSSSNRFVFRDKQVQRRLRRCARNVLARSSSRRSSIEWSGSRS